MQCTLECSLTVQVIVLKLVEEHIDEFSKTFPASKHAQYI